MRVGVEIEEVGGMEGGITPKGRRCGGMKDQAARDLGDLADSTLCDPILLRGVGESVSVQDAMGRAVGRKLLIEELATPVGVEATGGMTKEVARLLSPGNDD